MAQKRWSVARRAPADHIGAFAGLDPLLVQLLINRGITTLEEAHSFLAVDERLTYDPMLLDDMDVAIGRLRKALNRREPVAVYGDFDVDGITSTVLLAQALRTLGAVSVTPYIPHRLDEGYGLNCRALRSLHEQGIRLVVTVDCGTNSDREIAFARSLGMDVIITDHHSTSGACRTALATINPMRPDSRYPFRELAGVGVAFKVAQALFSEYSSADWSEQESSLLDLVALGTVADLAPLICENRYLVHRGLVALNRTARPGLREMALCAGVRLGSLNTSTIGYVLGPRLNAAGRLDDAIVSYNLLSTKSATEAADLASILETQNQERQRLTSEAILRAKEQVGPTAPEAPVLIISGKAYPQGIVGLVAGRLAEEFYRPALVIDQGEEECRGSARSIPEFNIIAALQQCSDLLVRFGGHAQAAGFTVRAERLDEFRHRLTELAIQELRDKDLCPTLTIDAEVALGELNHNAYQTIQRLAPFGYGNPTPTFLSRGVKLIESRVVGSQGNHLRLKLHDGRTIWPGIAFRQASALDRPVSSVDIVYSLDVNEWNGNQYLQLRIKDLRPAEA